MKGLDIYKLLYQGLWCACQALGQADKRGWTMGKDNPIWEALFPSASSSLRLSHTFNLVSRKIITLSFPLHLSLEESNEWNSLITITNSTSIPEVWEQTLQMLRKQLSWGRSWTCKTEQGFSNHSSELLVNCWKTNAASCHQHFQKMKYWTEIMSIVH